MYVILFTSGTTIIGESKEYDTITALVEDNEALPDETYIQSLHTGTVLTLREARLFAQADTDFLANW